MNTFRKISYLRGLVKRRLSTSASSSPKLTETDASGLEKDSLVEWLTSSTSTINPSPPPPPPITSNIFFQCMTNSSFKVLATTPPLIISSPQDQLALAKRLLSPFKTRKITLLRSPSTEPCPLHIEYSSPNIAKPLHMGHLRSTITGKFVKNVAEYAGHDCKTTCFLGDWGRQFGVLHAGVVDAKPSDDDVKFLDYARSLNLEQLLKIYVKSTGRCESDLEFNAKALKYSALLENRDDEECTGLWSHVRAVTVDHLKSCYSKLGITFDVFEGESEYHKGSPETEAALTLLESLGLTIKGEDGSLRLNLGGKEQPILLKKDKSSVYLLRDIACAMSRVKRAGDANTKFVYVVDNAQSHHFRNLFEALKLMGLSEQQQQQQQHGKNYNKNPQSSPFISTHMHVQFGRVSGMSTRTGNFVLITDVIETGTQLMHESRRNSKNARNIDDLGVSETLAISGMVVNALKVKRNKEYKFDWDEALSSKGNSGVALQYGVARLRSLLEKAGQGNDVVLDDDDDDDDDMQHLDVLLLRNVSGGGADDAVGGVIKELLVCLLNFETVFWRSYLTLEPCILVSYAFTVHDRISRALASVRVLDNPDEQVRCALVWLFGLSRNVLESCMRVIGVPVLEKGF